MADKNLVNQIQSELAAAAKKVDGMRESAVSHVDELALRIDRFREVAEELREACGSPLKDLADQFPNAIYSRSDSAHGYSGKVRFNHTAEFPATVEFTGEVAPDAEVKNLILSFNVSIRPVFIDYERSDQIEFDLESVDHDRALEWAREKIMGFVKTYMQIQFAEVYQGHNLVTDTVAGVRFPKHLASGQCELQGRTYYFISDETKRRFEAESDAYLGAPSR